MRVSNPVESEISKLHHSSKKAHNLNGEKVRSMSSISFCCLAVP
jgi:hypothetical protein